MKEAEVLWNGAKDVDPTVLEHVLSQLLVEAGVPVEIRVSAARTWYTCSDGKVSGIRLRLIPTCPSKVKP